MTTLLIEKTRRLLVDHYPEHSEFQIENFIIGSDGNEWGRYRQALRELAARVDGIDSTAAEIVALAAEVARSNAGGWCPIGRKKRRAKAAISKSRLDAKRAALRSKMREFAKFYRIARNLKRAIGDVSADRRRALEAEMWAEKARMTAAIDLLSVGGLQRSTVEFIVSFPREIRRKIIEELRPENRQKLLSIID